MISEGDGKSMMALIERLYPICRSITGPGVRESIRVLQEDVPLTVHEVPSGTTAFDWTVPREWHIRDAYVAESSGRRIIDFRRNNLHVLNYSEPVQRRMTLDELRPHLYAIPEQPDWIPYLTSYYASRWGFCLTQRQLDALKPGTYEVVIDSELIDGSLTYGEYYLPGKTRDEILVSTYICHPSMANDNLSSVAVAATLARHVAAIPDRKYSYRFLFIPETIGAIVWLSRHQADLAHIRGGLVLSCVGDAAPFTYKRSRRGNTLIDRVAEKITRDTKGRVIEFDPSGSDERQFCSPGFNLPVGCVMRSVPGKYSEYHTSADDLGVVSPEALSDTLVHLLEIVDALENDAVYVSLQPHGEPQLGKRGLYRTLGSQRTGDGLDDLALWWVLNLADGQHSLLDMAERGGMTFARALELAQTLEATGLFRREPGPRRDE